MGKDQIDSTGKKEDAADKKKDKDAPKDEKGQPLTEQDIALIKRYGKGPYFEPIKNAEADIKSFNQKISAMCGNKETDTGLCLPA